jgi:serine/threonine-protein kinase
MVRLRVLGGIDVRRDDGTAIDAVLRQPKRVALLAYLAASPGGVLRRRDAIVSMFWPEADDRHARDSLSAALSFLRRHVGAAAITTRGEEEIGCDPRHVVADVTEFLVLAEQQRDEEVLSLYRGDLLPGFHVQDAPGFEEWLERERSRLRALAAGSAVRLTDRAAGGRMAEATAAYARRAAELAPDDEKLLRRRISLEAAAGNRAVALRAYEEFAARLSGEFDAAPSPETVALVDAIREHRSPVRAAGALETVPGDSASAPPVSPPLQAEQSATRPRPVTETRAWWRRPSLGAPFVLIVGLVAVLALARRDPLVAADELPLIVVADLSASDTVLGVTAGAWLRSTLNRTLVVRSLEGRELADALRRMRRDPMRPLDDVVARELAMREGALGVVSGQITETKDGYTILVELVREDGRVVVRPTAKAASSTDVPAVLAALGERLRQSIVGSRQTRVALRPVTTSSLEALIAYTEGDRLRYNALDPRAAIPYYERAIQLDSTFAMAYSRLAGAWNALGSSAPTTDTVVQLWRTAVRFAEGLGPRELLAIRDGMIFANVDEPATMFDRAVQLYQNHVRLYPNDGPALQNLSWYLKHVGRWADSEAPALQALRAGHATPGLYDELVLGQLAAGKFDDAERSLSSWRARFGPSQLWYRDAFRLTAAKRDYAAGDSLTAEATRDRTWNVQPGRYPIATLAIRGRLREAGALHVRLMATLDQAGNHGAMIREASWFGMMRAAVTGDTAGSLAMLRDALRRHPPESLSTAAARHVYRDVSLHLALLGDTLGARAMLFPLQSNWDHYRLDYTLRGLLHVAAGRFQEAITELREVRHSSSHLPPLGRAYEAIGAIDSAIAVYERFLVEPDPDSPFWDAVFLVHVLERLGALYSLRGENRVAAARYQLVADLLREADPELRGRALRARDRAAEARRIAELPNGQLELAAQSRLADTDIL